MSDNELLEKNQAKKISDLATAKLEGLIEEGCLEDPYSESVSRALDSTSQIVIAMEARLNRLRNP